MSEEQPIFDNQISDTSFSQPLSNSLDPLQTDYTEFSPNQMMQSAGDTLIDIVENQGDYTAENELLIEQNFSQSQTSSSVGFTKSSGGWTNNNDYPRMLADVNGDGRADIVGFGNDAVFTSFGEPSANIPTSSGQLVGENPGNIIETVSTVWGDKNITVGSIDAGKNVNSVLAAIRGFENGGKYGSNGGSTPGDTGAATSIGAYQESYAHEYLPKGNQVMMTNYTLDEFYAGNPSAQDVAAIGRLQGYDILDEIKNANLYDNTQRFNIARMIVNAWGSWFSDRDRINSTPEEKDNYKLAHSQAIREALDWA